MHTTNRFLIAAGLLALAGSGTPARADITYWQDFRMCERLTKGCDGRGTAFVVQGETRRIAIKGQEVNTCKAVAISGTNVTVTKIGDKLIADGFGPGTGQIDISVVATGTAAPGTRTVTLSRCGVFGDRSFGFTTGIVRNGTAAGVNAVPRQSSYFRTVDLTITGTNIGGAAVRLASSNTSPNASPQISLVSSSATSAVVRLTFSVPQSKATGRIQLFAASAPGGCAASHTFACYGPQVEFTALGPNAVESITFPTGSNIVVGSILTIRVRLSQPAPSGGTRLALPGLSTSGELVKWDVHPEASFAPETGTAFSPTVELNSVTVPAGSEQIDLVVRFQQAPPGCSINGCTGTVEARVSDFRDAAPYKHTATFTMRPL
jgi:hypothetical protein